MLINEQLLTIPTYSFLIISNKYFLDAKSEDYFYES